METYSNYEVISNNRGGLSDSGFSEFRSWVAPLADIIDDALIFIPESVHGSLQICIQSHKILEVFLAELQVVIEL